MEKIPCEIMQLGVGRSHFGVYKPLTASWITYSNVFQQTRYVNVSVTHLLSKKYRAELKTPSFLNSLWRS